MKYLKYLKLINIWIITIIFSKKVVEKKIGVKLTDTFMMIPRKSVSGVMGQAISDYHNCMECQLTCEYRQKPYKE